MKKIINSIKNKYFIFLIFIIFSIIPFFSIINKLITQNSADFFIKNSYSIFNAFYTWDSAIFGSNSVNSIWVLFPLNSIYYFLNNFIGITPNITQFFVLSFLFLVGFISFYILIKELFNSEKINKVAIFIGSLFFIYNLYTIISLSGSFFLIIPYVFLPLQLYLFIKGVKSNQLVKYSVLLGFVNFLTFGVNLVFAVISVFLLISYGLWNIFIVKEIQLRKFIKFGFLSFITTLCLIAWWLIPLIYGSFIDKEAVQYVLSSEKFYNIDTSVINIFRNLGYWGFFSMHKGIPYREYASLYRNNPIVILSTFIIPIFIFTMLFFLSKIKEGKQKKKILFFYTIIIILFPFIGGSYKSWPTSNLMQWLFENIPLFSIFRNTYKWTSIIVFFYAIIITLFLNYILNFKKYKTYKKILLNYVLPLLLFIIILINAFPFSMNKTFLEKTKVKEIPKYWYDSSTYINNNLDENKNRILSLPNQYFPIFLWENNVKTLPSSIANSFFKVPTVSNITKGSGQPYSTEMIEFIFNNLKSKDIDKLLGLTGISHILQRNDYYSDYYGVEKPEEIKEIISKYHNIFILKRFGKLDFYQMKND